MRGPLAQCLAVGFAGSSDVLLEDRPERDKLDGVDLDLTEADRVAAALLDACGRSHSRNERAMSPANTSLRNSRLTSTPGTLACDASVDAAPVRAPAKEDRSNGRFAAVLKPTSTARRAVLAPPQSVTSAPPERGFQPPRQPRARVVGPHPHTGIWRSDLARPSLSAAGESVSLDDGQPRARATRRQRFWRERGHAPTSLLAA
jgi:hypothetical protein